MNFFETPLKRLRILLSVCALFAAAVAGLFALVLDIDNDGVLILATGAGICAVFGVVSLWLALHTTPEAVVYPDEMVIAGKAPVPDTLRVRVIRRFLWTGAFALPAMVVWVAYDLHRFESGAGGPLALPEEVFFIYRLAGYWGTVLSLSILCVAGWAAALRKLWRLESDDRTCTRRGRGRLLISMAGRRGDSIFTRRPG